MLGEPTIWCRDWEKGKEEIKPGMASNGRDV
jgi:hypothetical protein